VLDTLLVDAAAAAGAEIRFGVSVRVGESDLAAVPENYGVAEPPPPAPATTPWNWYMPAGCAHRHGDRRKVAAARRCHRTERPMWTVRWRWGSDLGPDAGSRANPVFPRSSEEIEDSFEQPVYLDHLGWLQSADPSPDRLFDVDGAQLIQHQSRRLASHTDLRSENIRVRSGGGRGNDHR
jgi:hypothetical protein